MEADEGTGDADQRARDIAVGAGELLAQPGLAVAIEQNPAVIPMTTTMMRFASPVVMMAMAVTPAELRALSA